MAVDPQTRQQLLELVYDVLPDDEAVELRRRIEVDADVARAYAEVQAARGVLAEAARLDVPKIDWKRPDGAAASGEAQPSPGKAPAQPKTSPRSSATIRRYWGRQTSWIVGGAAVLLILVSMGGYFYHREHLADIAADHLRLRVVGPSELHRGVAGRYAVTTTSVTGNPVSAQVQFALYRPGGEPLILHKEQTNDKGQLDLAVSADLKLPSEARLEIIALHDNKRERVDAWLTVKPIRLATYLTLDKMVYRPGETVRYRSLTLSPFGTAADREVSIRFEIVGQDGAVLAGSVLEGTTRHGVGCGEFSLPPGTASGRYTLLVRSLDGSFPEQRRTFFVGEGGVPDTVAERASTDPEAPDVRFFPEGGQLAAGLENRVYFAARDSRGRPVALRGVVVDSEDHPVAAIETTHEGLGAFHFEPQAGQQYRLNITSPEGGKLRPKLPEVSDGEISLSTGLGVFAAGRALQFNVRSTKAGIPLVASASCRGMPVGQQALVTKADANPVEIALDDAVAGVIRLTLYDYRASPPKPLAERLVYRQPARKLQVRLGHDQQRYSPGKRLKIPLAVCDENGQPAPAVLCAGVVEKTPTSLDETAGWSMPAFFLLANEIHDPRELENADFYLADDPKATVALDLVLGTRGWRRIVETAASQTAGAEEGKGGRAGFFLATAPSPAPPAVFDNLSELEKRYRDSLESYRTNRTRPQNALTMLSLFGGLGLLLFVTMLAILNIPTGLRLWVPSIIAAVGCLVIGAVLMDPGRLKSPPADAVAYAPFNAPPVRPGSLEPSALDMGGAREANANGGRADRATSDEHGRRPAPAQNGVAHGLETTTTGPATEAPITAAARLESRASRAAEESAGAKTAAEFPEATSVPAAIPDEPAAPAEAALEKGESKPMVFVLREYAYQRMPGFGGDSSRSTQTFYWHPLLLTDANGRAAVEFDPPGTAAVLRLSVDAHAPGGRIGSARHEIAPIE